MSTTEKARPHLARLLLHAESANDLKVYTGLCLLWETLYGEPAPPAHQLRHISFDAQTDLSGRIQVSSRS